MYSDSLNLIFYKILEKITSSNIYFMTDTFLICEVLIFEKPPLCTTSHRSQ